MPKKMQTFGVMEKESVKLCIKANGEIDPTKICCVKHSKVGKAITLRSVVAHFSNQRLHPELDPADVEQWLCVRDSRTGNNTDNAGGRFLLAWKKSTNKVLAQRHHPQQPKRVMHQMMAKQNLK